MLLKVSGARLAQPTKIGHSRQCAVGLANAGKKHAFIPLEQAFFSGGANGVRGWRLRTLGPGKHQSDGRGLGIAGVGDIRLDLQFEQRMHSNDLWQVALFSDMGNVWLHGEEVAEDAAWSWDLNDLDGEQAWGSMDLEFFLLRLDGGLRIHDPGEAQGRRWIGQGPWKGALHLGLGLPF